MFASGPENGGPSLHDGPPVWQIAAQSTTDIPYDSQIDRQYLHSGAIHVGQWVTAVRLSSRQALAVGDDAGRVSIVDHCDPTM